MLRQLSNIFVSHVPTASPVRGKVRGQLPAWLQGNFLFTCPGLLDIPTPEGAPEAPPFTVNHFGDGYALLGSFQFNAPDNVTLQTKFLQSDAYTKAIAAGKTVLPEYATPSSPDPTEKKKGGGIFSLLQGKTRPTSDNGNHAIFRLGDNFYATNGQAYFTQFNPQDLSTIQKFETKYIFGLSGLSAHPIQDKDPDNNSILWNIGASVGPTGAHTKFVKLQESSALFENFQVIGAIPPINSGSVSSVHSFGLTENYLIYVDTPTIVNFGKYLKNAISGDDGAILDMVEWLPEHKNRFHILDKRTGDLLTKDCPLEAGEAFYYSHYINCYEAGQGDDAHVVVDFHSFPNMAYTLGLTVDNMRNDKPLCTPEEEASLQRFKVPLKFDASAQLTPQPLSKARGLSGVNLNRRFIGRKNRYCYGHGSYTRGVYTNSAVKFDLESGEELKWNGGEHSYLTELTFVENAQLRGEGKELREDEGVLIGGVCDLRSDKEDYLIVLNAGDMKEIARVEFETKIPVYPHGLFVPK